MKKNIFDLIVVLVIFLGGCASLMNPALTAAENAEKTRQKEFSAMGHDVEQSKNLVGTWRFGIYRNTIVLLFEEDGNFKIFYTNKLERGGQWKIQGNTLGLQFINDAYGIDGIITSLDTIHYVDETHFFFVPAGTEPKGNEKAYAKVSNIPELKDEYMKNLPKEDQVIDMSTAFIGASAWTGGVEFYGYSATIYEIDGKTVNLRYVAGTKQGTLGTFLPVEAGPHHIKYRLSLAAFSGSGELNYVQEENKTTYFMVEFESEFSTSYRIRMN